MSRMVIFIGGLIGTGKTSIAKELAKQLDLPYYDVDAVKKRVYPTDPNYEYNLKNNIPFSDETRKKAFEAVVEDFRNLSDRHPHIVVDETLHKASLRQILFDGAKKYFGGYFIIWVQADESIIQDRLTNGPREGHILKDPFGMYLSFKKQFEDLTEADLVYQNNGTLDEAMQTLIPFFRAKL